MGREIRKVNSSWVHPVDEEGEYIPMFESDMPSWSKEEKTHIMMYETCSEGTPLSPVFDDDEKLARWLTDNKVSWFGDITATYEQWLQVCKDGYGGGLVIIS